MRVTVSQYNNEAFPRRDPTRGRPLFSVESCRSMRFFSQSRRHKIYINKAPLRNEDDLNSGCRELKRGEHHQAFLCTLVVFIRRDRFNDVCFGRENVLLLL